MEHAVPWRTSSYSGQDNECVELRGDLLAVRDSKNPAGPALTVSLTNLLNAVKTARLSR
jgi:Domain of unknown function (DUF397)